MQTLLSYSTILISSLHFQSTYTHTHTHTHTPCKKANELPVELLIINTNWAKQGLHLLMWQRLIHRHWQHCLKVSTQGHSACDEWCLQSFAVVEVDITPAPHWWKKKGACTVKHSPRKTEEAKKPLVTDHPFLRPLCPKPFISPCEWIPRQGPPLIYIYFSLTFRIVLREEFHCICVLASVCTAWSDSLSSSSSSSSIP